jgi:predicted dithiol-disulfide oxidoreductase (DUF899 family)
MQKLIVKTMTATERQNAIDYMDSVFNDKDYLFRDKKIWNDGKFNWLALRLLLFDYFDVEIFSQEQNNLYETYSSSKKGIDGIDPHYDYVGNTLRSMSETMKDIITPHQYCMPDEVVDKETHEQYLKDIGYTKQL